MTDHTWDPLEPRITACLRCDMRRALIRGTNGDYVYSSRGLEPGTVRLPWNTVAPGCDDEVVRSVLES